MAWNDNLDPESPAFGIAETEANVVAGPGTGKSFALKRRVARLQEQSVQPARILPVTFTNVAAEDLQREMLQVGVPGCEDIRGSTLHSLCMREVRIMSLHKSKGLSSPVVIIAGCVEGLLPTAPDEDLSPADRDAKLEEERRLFFVGLTRIKAEPGHGKPGVLVVTSSRTMSLADAKQSGIRPARVVYGTVHLHASRFIQELGPAAPATVRG